MRRLATWLLVFMAATYLAARWAETVYPAASFVRAFAEAAMVGGLADWFAVTALFRHPLGLPIPHTAIIPHNKDRIGDTLAQFLRDNFLTPAVVARRMARFDLAAAAGAFLAAPPDMEGQLRKGASRLFADVIASLDDERLGSFFKAGIADRLRALDVSPLLGQALDAAIREGRHEPVIANLIVWGSRTLDANEALIRQLVHDKSGKLLRLTGLDETLANAILSGLQRLLEEAAQDPAHPLRARVVDGLASLAERLQHDPAMQAQVARIRDEIVGNPAMQRCCARLVIPAPRWPGGWARCCARRGGWWRTMNPSGGSSTGLSGASWWARLQPMATTSSDWSAKQCVAGMRRP